jgi:hypothetical protein
MQRPVRERVGQEVVRAEPQELVQRGGRDAVGHDDHADAARLRGPDHLAEEAHVGLVLGGDGQRDEHEVVRLGLLEKGARLFEAEVAPAFAELGFHVLDQEIETMHVARHRAGDDRRRFGLQCQSATHPHHPKPARVFRVVF